MQYLFLCCFDEKQWTAIPSADRDGVMKQYGEWIDGAVKSGHYVGGAKLQPTANATTLRGSNGKYQPALTDGPYAETKEQLGGYHLVECKDLNEALALASRIPTLGVGGTIEVRPVEYAAP